MSAWIGPAAERVRALALFYRMRSWQNKVSGLRPILYTLFGFALAARWHPQLFLANLLAVVGLLMFLGAYGNYWDWRLLGERNSTQQVITRYRLSAGTALAWTFAPWLGIVPLCWMVQRLGGSATSGFLFWSVACLGILYIAPGARLKIRNVGLLIPVLVGCLLFLQAYMLHGTPPWSAAMLVLVGLLGVFQFQAELLHLLDDHLHSASEPVRMSRDRLLAWLTRVPQVSCGASLIAACLHPVFLNTTLWSLVRLKALRRLSFNEVTQQRQQLWRPLWSLYEFGIYAALGIFHRFV